MEKDWAGLQRADPVLSQFMSLKTILGDTSPTREQLAIQGDEVRTLCVSWPLFRVEEGVLKYCQRAPETADSEPQSIVACLLYTSDAADE